MKKAKNRKLKTRKSVSKRFVITKKGKVLHRSHNLRHLRSSKSNSQIRRLKKLKVLHKTMAIKIKKYLGK